MIELPDHIWRSLYLAVKTQVQYLHCWLIDKRISRMPWVMQARTRQSIHKTAGQPPRSCVRVCQHLLAPQRTTHENHIRYQFLLAATGDRPTHPPSTCKTLSLIRSYCVASAVLTDTAGISHLLGPKHRSLHPPTASPDQRHEMQPAGHQLLQQLPSSLQLAAGQTTCQAAARCGACE